MTVLQPGNGPSAGSMSALTIVGALARVLLARLT